MQRFALSRLHDDVGCGNRCCRVDSVDAATAGRRSPGRGAVPAAQLYSRKQKPAEKAADNNAKKRLV